MLEKDKYFEYKGVKYGIGTTVLAKDNLGEDVEMVFCGWKDYGSFRRSDDACCGGIRFNDINTKIIKIIDPIYWRSPEPKQHPPKGNIFTRTGSGSYQHSDDVVWGTIIYIAVMLVGSIFKDNWLIWIVATIIFFTWKRKL